LEYNVISSGKVMSASNTPNRPRQLQKLSRGYESSEGGSPSPGRFRPKRNCYEQEGSSRAPCQEKPSYYNNSYKYRRNRNPSNKNHNHCYSASPSYSDDNACDQFYDENERDNPSRSPSRQYTSGYQSPRLNPKESVDQNITSPKVRISYEEEKIQLAKSLSHNWCDKIDLEEEETKKLYSFVLYLKNFNLYKDKTNEEILSVIECCPKELCRRQKDISKGKLTKSYEIYAKSVLRKNREPDHPKTPCKYKKCSRRAFDGMIKIWRRRLHMFDKNDGIIEETKPKLDNIQKDDLSSSVSTDPLSSQSSNDWSSQSSSSLSTTDDILVNDENFLPDLYDFEESLIPDNETALSSSINDEKDGDLVFGAVTNLETDSMDTLINSDSRQSKCANPEDVPPVIATPHHYLINIYRNSLYFVAVLTTEVPPLFVIEFLHRIMDVFEDYFGECTETALKDNYVIVYELLDEMLDSGYPLATESNILKELIKPPNIFRKVANLVTGDNTNISATLPSSQLSNVPWRRMGLKYTNNEAYFDLIEEIDAIIDKNGTTVMCEIQGYIDCCVKLSGMPDLTLSFVNPRLLDDVSFHPCVRFKKWESDRVLSFIPPDGNFRLISYHIGAQKYVFSSQPRGFNNGNKYLQLYFCLSAISIPIYVKHNIQFRDGSGGRFELTVGPKQTMGKPLESVVVESVMSKVVLNCTLTPSQGKYTFDPVKKILLWDVGKIDSSNPSNRLPTLKGNIVLQSGQPMPESNPVLNIRFTLNQTAISGIRVNRVDMYGEKYKPFKGVKYVTKAGRFQVRT
ncbi:unnamed protein product, partial [Didymodactylos carnosus]